VENPKFYTGKPEGAGTVIDVDAERKRIDINESAPLMNLQKTDKPELNIR
jgi:hypothetical protein